MRTCTRDPFLQVHHAANGLPQQGPGAALDRIRAEADHFVNVKAEAEIIDLHTKLDQLRVELSLKLDTLGRRLPKA